MNIVGLDMDKKILRGIAIMLVKECWSKLLGVVGIVILARALLPAEVGYFAMVYAVIDLMVILTTKNFFVHVIRERTMDDGQLADVLRTCTLWGMFMSGLLYLSAPFFAAFFRAPALAGVLQLVSPVLLIRALALVPSAAIYQRLWFFRGALIRVIAEMVFWCVAVWLAWHG